MTKNVFENEITIFTPKIAGYLAFGSIGALVLNIVFAGVLGFESAFDFFGPLYRLLLIPAVAFLPAPHWAKMAGWLWILFDSTLNIGGINGMEQELILQLRLGIHLAFGVWAVAVGWLSSGGHRWSAFAVGIVTAGYSFVAPWVPQWVLASTALLLMFFIIMSAIKLIKVED
ncbi:MAG: hypothetical protein AAGD96_00455 [Chloroflexota bacterium]